MTKQIIAINAFYKSNTSGGLTVTIPYVSTFVSLTHVVEIIDAEYEKRWVESISKSSSQAFIKQLEEELTAFGMLRAPLQFIDAIVAFANVYWLEKIGHIKTDEWNGVQYLITKQTLQ